MKRTHAQNIRLGIFIILGSVVFTAAIYFIGSKQNRFGNTAELNATFKNVNGLQPGNNVRYSGIDVGTVRKIKMENDTTIVINMTIQADILRHIDQNAIATIGSDGLVGNMIVNIVPGKIRGLPVTDGGSIATYSRINTDDILNTLNVTNENAALLTADLLVISRQIIQGKGSIGILLNDTLMANNMQNTLRNLNESSRETTQMIRKLNHFIGSLDKDDNLVGVVNDTAVASQVRSIIYNLDKSSAGIDSMTTNMNVVVNRVKNGKGAINYLSEDREFVEKLDSLVTNLNEATILLKEDLEAVKHNFLLRGYFRKKEKKQRDENK